MEVKVPDGDSPTGTVSFVYVDEGTQVAKGEPLIEIVTDKATTDIPTPESGIVRSICVTEDESIKIGDVICQVDTE